MQKLELVKEQPIKVLLRSLPLYLYSFFKYKFNDIRIIFSKIIKLVTNN